MRHILYIIILTLILGCIPRTPAPDPDAEPVAPPPILLSNQQESLVVIDLGGNPVQEERVRIDTVTIADTTLVALASRSSGIFRWTGQIYPGSTFECFVGIGDAPVQLFNVMGMIPPINSYGHFEAGAMPGMTFRISANGEKFFEITVPPDNFEAWTEVSVDLSNYAGEQIELTFESEGILVGTVLPYWGNPRIIASVQ